MMGNPLLPNLPGLPSLTGFDNGPTGSSSPSATPAQKPPKVFSTGSVLLDSAIGGILNATGLGTPTNNPNMPAGGILDRIIAIILGLILITAGLFLFKPVSENVTRVVRGAIA